MYSRAYPDASSINMTGNTVSANRWYINDKKAVGDYTTEMVIHNVTREYHDAIVKCEVYNEVGKSEETKTLDVTCEYMQNDTRGGYIEEPEREREGGRTCVISC